MSRLKEKFMTPTHESKDNLMLCQNAHHEVLESERDKYIAKSVELEEHLRISRKIVDELQSRIKVLTEALRECKRLAEATDLDNKMATIYVADQALQSGGNKDV